MLLLASTTETLRVVTSAACSVDVYAAFVDYAAAEVIPRAPQATAITTATTTVVVAAPGASTTRNVKSLHVRNTHATTSVTVTVQFYNGTTAYALYTTTLAAGIGAEYLDDVGFRIAA